jgi:hypothetical protein
MRHLAVKLFARLAPSDRLVLTLLSLEQLSVTEIADLTDEAGSPQIESVVDDPGDLRPWHGDGRSAQRHLSAGQHQSARVARTFCDACARHPAARIEPDRRPGRCSSNSNRSSRRELRNVRFEQCPGLADARQRVIGRVRPLLRLTQQQRLDAIVSQRQMRSDSPAS